MGRSGIERAPFYGLREDIVASTREMVVRHDQPVFFRRIEVSPDLAALFLRFDYRLSQH